MNTLYLVGNGFDCHHKIETSYLNYRKIYADDIDRLLHLLEISDGMVEWSDFENEIGRITDEFITNNADLSNIDGLYELKLLLMNVMKINMFEWIKAIDMKVGKVEKSDFYFDDTDCFVTFNYTHTLEEVYKIDDSQILHIHGDCKKVDEKLINSVYQMKDSFTNDKQKDIPTHLESLIISDEIKLGTKDMGTYDLSYVFEEKNECLAETLRDIGEIICKEDEFENCKKKLIQFLENRKIDEVCILGNKYSGIDQYYYENILYDLFSNKRWKVYVYSDDDRQMYEQVICKRIKNVTSCKWPQYV